MYNDHERCKADLTQAKSTGLQLNAIICSGSSYFKGQILNGKNFPLEVMLEQSLQPYDKCTKGKGCNCTYSFFPVRDENDRLIRQEY